MAETTGETVLIPLDRELQERVSWLIRLRWLAGLGLVVGSMVGLPLFDFPAPHPVLTAVGVAVLGYNQILFLFGGRLAEILGSFQRTAHVQIALDWAALVAVIALTGGIRSPATVAFVFHLIIGAILLSRQACYWLTATAIGLTALLGRVTPQTLLDPVDTAGPPLHPGATVLDLWIALTALFTVTTYLATSITARLREKEAALSQSERSLERAYRGMEALHELGQLVNSTLDLDRVLALIAQHAARLLNCKATSIRLLDSSGRVLSLGAAHGLSDAYVRKGPVDVERSGVDRQVLEDGPVQVLDVAAEPGFQYPEEARREGLHSMLACAMRAEQRVLGVIRVYSAEPRRFSEQEQQLLMNLANLGAVAIQNARAYSELQAIDRQRVWFARTTHHQLRAPLAAIQGALDALPFAGPLTPTQADLVNRARRRIQDAFDTIRDLLDLAASQQVDTPPPPVVRFDEAIRRTVESIEERCRLKGLAFSAELPVGPTWVRADPTDLERILTNLLDNAVKYTPEGRVDLRVTATEGWLEVTVADTGIGIPPADLGRIFESFFRGAAARQTGEMGTGLGLAIVKTLVGKLGGTIDVQSEAGAGTRFTVRLPIVSAPVNPSPPAGPVESHASIVSAPAAGPTA